MRAHISRTCRAVYHFLIRRPSAVWLGAGTPTLLLLLAYHFPDPPRVSDNERIVIAAFLEFVGLVLIAVGYIQLRAQFGRPGVLQSLKQYLADFRAALQAGGANTVTGTIEASIEFVAGATMEIHTGPNEPMEHRLEIVESKLRALETQVRSLAGKVDGELSTLRVEFKRVKADIEAELRSIRILVEHASIGDAGSEVIGWLWLLSGVMISSWQSWGIVLGPAP